MAVEIKTSTEIYTLPSGKLVNEKIDTKKKIIQATLRNKCLENMNLTLTDMIDKGRS